MQGAGMSDPAIRTTSLTRAYGRMRAVDDLNLIVERGSIFALLGPNGSGKTTTVRLLLGLLKATSGTGTVLGYEIGRQAGEIRLRTGVLLDSSGLYDKLTALSNLRFYGDVYHIAPEKREARIQELLEFAGLWDRRNEQVEKWSKGMRQKLAIVRSVLHEPELLVMDEPTTGLDPVSIKMVRDLIVSLAQTQRHTIFLCTHNLDEAERICDQVAVIKQGHLLLQDSPSALRQRMTVPQIEISATGLTDDMVSSVRALPFVREATSGDGTLKVTVSDLGGTQEIVRTLVLAGASIEEVRKPTASLEDVYLQLVGKETEE
jgi:ABC-2 type transport system ATP-binding protein